MVGELAVIGSAFLWAGSSIMFTALVREMEPLLVNLVRILIASLFLGLVLGLVAAFDNLGQLSVMAGLSLAGTSVVTWCVGDTMYIRSLALIGAARGVPIATTLYPVLTFTLAFLLLDEELTWLIGLGTALVVLGIFLIARPAARGREPRPADVSVLAKGVGLALATGTAWALGTIWLRTVLDDHSINPVTASAVRAASASLLMSLFVLAAKGPAAIALVRYRRPTLVLAVASGVVGSGLASLLYLVGVQQAGAGKAAVLASTAPLFALPMAALLLAERPTARVVFGTLLAVGGIYLVI